MGGETFYAEGGAATLILQVAEIGISKTADSETFTDNAWPQKHAGKRGQAVIIYFLSEDVSKVVFPILESLVTNNLLLNGTANLNKTADSSSHAPAKQLQLYSW